MKALEVVESLLGSETLTVYETQASGKERGDWVFRFTASAYNITRMKALIA